jgi:tetratricopeptide (TPR) repeat protein
MGVAVVVGVAAAAAAGMQPVEGVGQQAPQRSMPGQVTARMLSDATARLAIFDLRAATRPTDTDYRIAALLLGVAHELQPTSSELLRRQLEAAWGAGDHEQVLEITRSILALDPHDTVAQLRLITASIAGANQTAEQRLAAYERFIGNRQFAASIRSRLALDAALLLRERGDEAGFVEKLKQSMAMDSTHKEAAALAATYFAERMPEDRVGRLTLLQNLLLADPVDPNVHMTIARELVAGRAYRGALRAYRTAISIVQASGSPLDEEMALQSRVLQWHTEGPTAVARDIRSELMTQRGEAMRQLQRFRGQVPRGATRPEDIRLSLPLAIMGVVAAKASGDADALRDAYSEFMSSLRHAMEMLEDPEQRARIGDQRASQIGAELVMQLQMVRLWAEMQVEVAADDLSKSEGLQQFFPDQYAVLDAWAKLRSEGDAGEVLAQLQPYVADNYLARLGAAIAQERAGNSAEAITHYERLVRDAPLSTFAAWARTRLDELGIRQDAAGVAALERAAAQIPQWIDRMITHPHEFIQLTIRHVNPSPEIIQSAPLKITIENLARSQVPLALGADRAINSRLLLAPKLENQDHALNPWVRPEIVDIDRRLRLMPGERLEVVVNPDYGHAGWLMESLGARSLRLRWRATQGFVFTQQSGFLPGVMCLVGDSDAVVRRPLPESNLPLEDMLQRVATGVPSDVPRIAAVLRSAALQPALMGEVVDPEQRQRIREAREDIFRAAAEVFATRYPLLSPQERAAVAALLPHARLEPGLERFDQALRAEEDPLPLAIILATRVTDPEDELLVKAGGSPDPRTRQLAFLIAERLGAGDTTYAKMTIEDLQRRASQPEPEAQR